MSFRQAEMQISQENVTSPSTLRSPEHANNVSMQEPGSRRSWVLENNFARRELRNDVNYIICQVQSCRKADVNRDFSTSNIRRHLQSRHGINANNCLDRQVDRSYGPLDNFVVDGQFRAGRLSVEVKRETWRQQLARFVVTSQSALSIVENMDLCELLRMTHQASSRAMIAPISADTVKRDIEAMYREKKLSITSYLQLQLSLSFTLDMWTSEWGTDFLAITAHFIDENWKQREVLIGFEHPEERHTGEELANMFLGVLDDFGITHLLFTIPTDNGSNIIKMVKEVELIADTRGDFFFDREMCHIPCLHCGKGPGGMRIPPTSQIISPLVE